MMWGRGALGEGDEELRMCRKVTPPKGILVKLASHCTHGGRTLTRYHYWCGANNGVCRDPVVPMIVVTLLVCAGTHGWCNYLYECFEWLI